MGSGLNSMEGSLNIQIAIDILKNRNFSLLTMGQVISQLGENLNKVAMLWFVYQFSHKAADLAWVGILQTLPPLLFGWFTGPILDRVSRKNVMIFIDITRGLLLLLIPVLYHNELLTLPILFILVFLISVVSGIFGPALYASIPELVRRDQIVSANALMQTTGQVGMLLGPITGGVLIGLWNAPFVMIVNAVTFFLSALFLLMMKLPSPHRSTAFSFLTLLQETREGFQFVFNGKSNLLPLFVIMTLYGFITGPFSLILPVYTKLVLHQGPQTLGFLLSIMGLGMLGASMLLTSAPPIQYEKWIAGALIFGGLMLTATGWLQPILFASITIALIGASFSAFNPLAHTIIQTQAPEILLARTLSTMSIGFLLGAIGGMGLFPALLHLIGVGPVFSLMGLIFLIGGLIFLRRSIKKESPQETLSIAQHLPISIGTNRNES